MPKRDLWLDFCCLAELNTLQNQYFSPMFRRSHIVPAFCWLITYRSRIRC